MHSEAYRMAEEVARHAYGRLLAYLSARSGDLVGAEDALSDAFLRALQTWPERGIPPQPEAWLLHTARNRLIDAARHRRVQERAMAALVEATQTAEEAMEQDMFPDERLKLMFLCAHPAIDVGMQTPLMLQTVLGFDAARIASAFLVAPSTMSQRLVRAKAKIRESNLSFELPAREQLTPRLQAVLEAVYAVYGQGWDDLSPEGSGRESLAAEALYLTRLLVKLLPEEPEAQGLLALILYYEARRKARRSAEGDFVPLMEQDVALWSPDLLAEAERTLMRASEWQRVGRFQLEAAIQSVHVERRATGKVNWQAIAHLYEGLIQIAPTMGSLVGQASATAEWQGPEAGLTLLNRLAPEAVRSFQPYWAVRAHLLNAVGQTEAAMHAFDIAIGLTAEESVRRFLRSRRSVITESSPTTDVEITPAKT